MSEADIMTNTANYEITAIFTQDDFILDSVPALNGDSFDQTQARAIMDDFAKDKWKSLYDLGFEATNEKFSPTFAYLHYISEQFSYILSRDSDIEITRKAPSLTDDVKADILRAMPYGSGVEFVNRRWIENIWASLSGVANREIDGFTGFVSEYLRGKNAALNVVGRVFFHLVENKKDDAPFAFLSTYSTGERDKVSHLPLKNALLECKGDNDKLLALMSTVTKVADKSELISEFYETGEL
jgi:non-specific serine/threonine protein kinase